MRRNLCMVFDKLWIYCLDSLQHLNINLLTLHAIKSNLILQRGYTFLTLLCSFCKLVFFLLHVHKGLVARHLSVSTRVVFTSTAICEAWFHFLLDTWDVSVCCNELAPFHFIECYVWILKSAQLKVFLGFFLVDFTRISPYEIGI